MNARPALFAQQGWYPARESECRELVRKFTDVELEPARLGGLVPHAGWFFSGACAGKSFAALAGAEPEVVFLFGGHTGPGARPALMTAGAYATPLGEIAVHEPLAGELAGEFSCRQETATDFEPDNTIELQLPFIRHLWPQARLVAVRVPADDTAGRIGTWAAQAAERAGLRSLALGSTDLTHYGPNYGFMPWGSGAAAHQRSKQENDRPFLEHLLQLAGREALDHARANHSACCPGAALALVEYARARGATGGRLLEHVTSAEVEGRSDFTMWVGYAALVF